MTESKHRPTGELKTPRVSLRRVAKLGHYDWDTVAGVLDKTFICNVGYVIDGQPIVIPTSYGRDGRTLYIHGSAASQMLRAVGGGIPICVTVHMIDALVLSRSIFNHTVNYHSVVIMGEAKPVHGEEKLRALRLMTENIIPGRWDEAREPTESEMKQTSVLSIEINEASAKIRTAGVPEFPEDLALPHWAGIIPLTMVAGEPISDHRLAPGTPVPGYASDFQGIRLDRPYPSVPVA
jgi:nitroimidazol reductase NimA-like FMN-containing flavoprotein (pyridoxamine 5'-phosphate oxidase superfamily)